MNFVGLTYFCIMTSFIRQSVTNIDWCVVCHYAARMQYW